MMLLIEVNTKPVSRRLHCCRFKTSSVCSDERRKLGRRSRRRLRSDDWNVASRHGWRQPRIVSLISRRRQKVNLSRSDERGMTVVLFEDPSLVLVAGYDVARSDERRVGVVEDAATFVRIDDVTRSPRGRREAIDGWNSFCAKIISFLQVIIFRVPILTVANDCWTRPKVFFLFNLNWRKRSFSVTFSLFAQHARTCGIISSIVCDRFSKEILRFRITVRRVSIRNRKFENRVVVDRRKRFELVSGTESVTPPSPSFRRWTRCRTRRRHRGHQDAEVLHAGKGSDEVVVEVAEWTTWSNFRLKFEIHFRFLFFFSFRVKFQNFYRIWLVLMRKLSLVVMFIFYSSFFFFTDGNFFQSKYLLESNEATCRWCFI